MTQQSLPKWEEVAEFTWRLPVPGGWLYRLALNVAEGAMVFVPEPTAQYQFQQNYFAEPPSHYSPAQWPFQGIGGTYDAYTPRG